MGVHNCVLLYYTAPRGLITLLGNNSARRPVTRLANNMMRAANIHLTPYDLPTAGIIFLKKNLGVSWGPGEMASG